MKHGLGFMQSSLTKNLSCVNGVLVCAQARERQAAAEQEKMFLVADAKPSKKMDQEQKVCECAVGV